MPSSEGLQRIARDVSTYLILLILVSTLGPLQFGFHLVSYCRSLLPLPPFLSINYKSYRTGPDIN